MSEAEEWDVRRFVEALKASGLDGISHEDGWTLMMTETVNKLKADLARWKMEAYDHGYQP